MGRKERRELEKIRQKEAKMTSITVSKDELKNFKDKHVNEALVVNSTGLYMCFAYSLMRLYHFNQSQILEVLEYIENLAGDINTGKINFETIANKLNEEVGLQFRLR